MATHKIEIAYLECTKGGSNKWYVGIDLTDVTRDGSGITGYGAMGAIQSLTYASAAEMHKKVSEKLTPRKGYRSNMDFGAGWGGAARQLREAIVRAAREIIAHTHPSVHVDIEIGGGGQAFLKVDTGIETGTPVGAKLGSGVPAFQQPDPEIPSEGW